MQLDNAVNNLDNVEQIDSELSALSSIDSDLNLEDTLEAEMLEVIGVSSKVDDALSETSENAVQNRVITAEINAIKETYATKDFVEENGGKIDSISINNVQQDIVNKNVNIDLSGYATNNKVDNLEDSIDNISKDLTNIADDLQAEIEDINEKFNEYATNSRVDEVESIAKGANQAISFADYSEMVEAIEKTEEAALGVGQNIMIVELNVPDLWISGRESTFTDYTFTNNEDFVEQLKQGRIKIGYYYVSALETQKVDLTGYREKITNANKLYATDSAGNQTEVSYGTGLSASMIVQRGAGGQIATTDPTADVHVVNLKTMNAALEEKYQELYDMIPDVVRRI